MLLNYYNIYFKGMHKIQLLFSDFGPKSSKGSRSCSSAVEDFIFLSSPLRARLS